MITIGCLNSNLIKHLCLTNDFINAVKRSIANWCTKYAVEVANLRELDVSVEITFKNKTDQLWFLLSYHSENFLILSVDD